MKTGYDQFFKQAQKVAASSPQTKPQKPRVKRDSLALSMDDEVMIEKKLRQKMNLPEKRNVKKPKKISWGVISFSLVGLVLAYWGFENHEKVDHWLSRVEVSILGQASAQNTAATQASSATPAETVPKESEAKQDTTRDVASSEGDFEHLKRIKERTIELDKKEEELARVESELAAQKIELQKRIEELEKMRASISTILEDRVKADQEKVDTLVQVYTNMKPVQAAKVIETIDEDLAVDILSRMKKKSAADIMNMLKPEKAQIFTEKLAGFKK